MLYGASRAHRGPVVGGRMCASLVAPGTLANHGMASTMIDESQETITLATTRRARLSHARRMGAARRHLDRVAAQSLRLAGQVRTHPVDLRRDRSSSGARRAGQHSGGRRGRRSQGARRAGSRPCASGESRQLPASPPAIFASSTSQPIECGRATPARFLFVAMRAAKPAAIRAKATSLPSRPPRGDSMPGPNTTIGNSTRPSAQKSPNACVFRHGKPEVRIDGELHRIVLEGGSIDVNGRGTLITTEECLLSDSAAA